MKSKEITLELKKLSDEHSEVLDRIRAEFSKGNRLSEEVKELRESLDFIKDKENEMKKLFTKTVIAEFIDRYNEVVELHNQISIELSAFEGKKHKVDGSKTKAFETFLEGVNTKNPDGSSRFSRLHHISGEYLQTRDWNHPQRLEMKSLIGEKVEPIRLTADEVYNARVEYNETVKKMFELNDKLGKLRLIGNINTELDFNYYGGGNPIYSNFLDV